MSFSCRRAWNHHWSAAPAPGAGCCCFVMRFFLFGLLFLPNLCFQTFTPLCHQRLFFDSLVAVSTGVPISDPALEITLECLFPEPSRSPLVPLSHSVSICQTEQPLSPNPNNPSSPSHTCFGVRPFLAQVVIYRTCWGVARTCLWGRVLVFWRLFWVTRRRWKHLLVLLELSCSGAGYCSQVTGHGFGLGEVESCR